MADEPTIAEPLPPDLPFTNAMAALGVAKAHSAGSLGPVNHSELHGALSAIETALGHLFGDQKAEAAEAQADYAEAHAVWTEKQAAIDAAAKDEPAEEQADTGPSGDPTETEKLFA